MTSSRVCRFCWRICCRPITEIDCGVSRTLKGSLPRVGCGAAAASRSPLTVTAGSVAASRASSASAGPAASASHNGQWRATAMRAVFLMRERMGTSPSLIQRIILM